VIEGDHLAYRYETLQELGRGTFGQVVKCRDHKTGNYVAIKLTKSFGETGLESSLREVHILETARQVQSAFASRIVHLEDYFKFRNHLCIVFELLAFDIYRDIKNKTLEGFKTIEQLQNIVCQLVEGLIHLKESGITHCDLKPENIMYVNEDRKEIKIVDLGSAKGGNERGFSYVCSRYYRAPEIAIGGINYSFPSDMWSLGCLVSEMVSGVPLFPAYSEHELLEFHQIFCGTYSQEMVKKSGNKKKFFVEDLFGNYTLKEVPNSRVTEKVRKNSISKALFLKRKQKRLMEALGELSTEIEDAVIQEYLE
jgi:dual specificity tyrosine-phosphorylation-regulated kinase 2/3/4